MRYEKFIALFILLTSLWLSGCTGQPAGNTAMDHSTMDDNTNAAASPNRGDHNSMGHSTMQSSPGAASADVDLQFLDTMIAHHQAAIDMAKMIPDRTKRPELTKLAANVISSQQKEIDSMRTWREKWFSGKSPAINMDYVGMKASMDGMDMNKLGSSTGKPFELEFISQMIPHHEGAIAMSKDILQRSKKDEIKTLANNIIKDQQAEIDQMKKWQVEWR